MPHLFRRDCRIPCLPFVVSLLLAVPVAAQNDLVQLEEAAFKHAAGAAADAIVQIRTIGGLEQREGVILAAGPTSGVILDPEGWIVSSAYNFAEKPSSILVSLPGGKTAAARLVATDHSRMIVLLKVDHDAPLPTPAFAEGAPHVGQWSLALGKAYSQTQVNISTGIISATGRMHGRAIQTDAKVSAVNYGGPLVDIHGRVLGILVPMSPQSDSAVAGAEWYDSGIGFAIPIEQILARLDALKTGEDQWPGKLGIALKEGPAYSTPAEVAAVEPNSPADEAGLEKGDVIVEVDGTPVADQTDLSYQIKPRYAGETIGVTVRRGEQTLSRDITLTDKLRPYIAGFLGVLPERITGGEDNPGLPVRFVYPGSPAARAGLRRRDRITRIGDTPIVTVDDAFAAMQSVPAGEQIELEITREGDAQSLTLQAVALPEEVPADVPAPQRPAGDLPEVAVETGSVPVKLPDLTRECPAYVPRTYRPDVPHGLLVWLADSPDDAQSTEAWTELCDRYDLILLRPAPAGDNWEQEDLEYTERVVREVSTRYTIDPHRIAVGGKQAGATAAFAMAQQMRERVRGLVALAGGPPRQLRLASEPISPLAILFAFDEQGQNGKRLSQVVEVLRDAALPVTTVDASGDGKGFTDDLRATIARWTDTLDRF